MLKLKKGVDTVAFLKQVDACQEDVSICTKEGECLNLKSSICRMVFTLESAREEFIQGAFIHCENEADYELLKEYISD